MIQQEEMVNVQQYEYSILFNTEKGNIKYK